MASGEGGGGDATESWRNEKYYANNRSRNEKQRDKNNESRSYREFSNSGGSERRLSTYSRKPVRERYTYRYDDTGEWIGEPGKLLQESTDKSQSQMDLKARAATLQYNLPEDMRISKLLRRLCGENDPSTAIDLCEKLKMVLQDKSNAAYIHRSFDILADSIISVIEKGPRECLFLAAEAFGLMGYVVRNDFPKYKTWILKMYKKSKSLKIYMMKALLETIKQDSNSLDLRDQSGRLMELLKDFLEAVDVPEIFLAIIDVIVVVCRNYPKNFESYFTDIVDIVVGWHLEAEQSFETKFHISKVLQEFKPFWEKDIKFTLNLMTLFLEDIAACGDEINHKKDEEDESRNNSPFFLDKSVLPEFCFGSFVGAFNTVLKCLYTTPEMLVCLVGKELLEESFSKIMQVAAKAMEQNHSEEIVMPVNEYICLLIECQKADIKIPIDEYFQLLRIELKNNQKYSTKQVLSLLMVILKTVNQYKGNLQLEFVGMLFNPSSEFLKIRFWKNERVHKGLIKIYHEILNIKNVLLLQEAYKHILKDIEKALRSLVGMQEISDILRQQRHEQMAEDKEEDEVDTSDVYTELQAEIVLNFDFSALSALATTNNSIMAMWALQPSLLELLAHKMRLADIRLWHNRYQIIHFAFLKLLSSHCMINNNFITSSVLLNTKNSKMAEVFNKLSMLSSSQSPTSEHFGLIIVFLCEILKNDRELTTSSSLADRNSNTTTVTILLDWCNDLFSHIAQYAEILKTKPEFTAIVKRINAISINAANNSYPRTTLKCAICLDTLLSTFETLHVDCYTSIAEICCVLMCSVNFELREKYSFLFAMLPLKYSLKQVNEFSGRNEVRAAHIGQLQQWHVSSDISGTLRPQYFKAFIEKIQFSKDAEHIEEYLKEIFPKCWYVDQLAPNSVEYMEMAGRDIRCLISWIQWETAQFCVNNKLRTPIGKPQDTFLKIESILKEDARILALKEKTTVKNIKTLIANYKQIRVLLGFMEALEKSIYNASDGTAFAMPPVENPAKTFFRINTSTCHEWFNRIRGAVDLVALHGMESEMVIRYSQNVLKEMTESGRTNDAVFEHTLKSLCWALLRNGESDSIYGLYVWIKAITNNSRKHGWIKMAAEQAAGHRELAADGYLQILQNSEVAEVDETNNHKLDPYTREFIVDMTTEALLFTGRWLDLKNLFLKEENRSIPRITIPLVTMSSAQIDCIMKFEETKDINVFDLSNWEMLDKGPNIPSNFSCHRLISLVENTLGNILLGEDPFPVDTSRYVFRIIHSLLQESLRTRSTEYLNQLTIINHICHKTILCKLKDRSAGDVDIKSLIVDKEYGSFTLWRTLFWSEYFDDYTKEGEQQNIDIRLDIVSIARKETNYQMCKRELEKFYQKCDYAKKLNMVGTLNVDNIREHLLAPAEGVVVDVDIWDENLSRAVYEQCKWMYATSFNAHGSLCYATEDAIQLAAAATTGICQRLTNSASTTANDEQKFANLREKAARYLLKLSEWLQSEHESLITNDVNSPLTRLVTVLPDVKPEYAAASISFIPLRDAAVGKLIQYSCSQYPDLAKVWGAFGAWCYRWGRKMVELKLEASADVGGCRSTSLKNADITEIRKILTTASDTDIDQIVEILNQHQIAAEDEEVICDNSSSTELIENQLRTSVACLTTEAACNLEAIVKIWKQSRRNIYSYYEMSADAYFKYLKLATTSNTNKNTPHSNDEVEQHDSSVITATLRILRLIVKHALGLQDVLEEGLASTPTSPWKIIIPQLFSRLNHPEPYVRRRVSELLCRVAKDSPHLIIFPTVVGAVAAEKRLDISLNNSGIAADGGIELDTTTTGLICGFQSLLDTLSHQSPETVEQVKVLVHELKRIALLWDDLWLVSLTQIYIECSKKFKLFFDGAIGEADHKPKVDVASEKYRIVMLPVIFVMEKLHEVTSRKAETKYEKNFQDRYSKFIEDTIKEMKMPSNVDKLTEGWQRFKTLFGKLKQQAQKRPQYTLKMSDISPVLAQLHDTSISMPGVDNIRGSGDVFIKSIDNLVHILPTKTKPKKLIFHGSDGRQYTFLFKGLEDLHLDERIMQFLSIANLMMTKSVDSNGSVSFYRARHYSVIPLGPRSGLISWVDNVTPIFNLYKKWQQREASNPKRDKNFAVLRTSEIFYNKLTPLLAEHNLKITDNRKEWPLSVLRKVLKELTDETPRDLLAKELWCTSTTAAVWRKAVRNYSLSLAVMSVIGYIIGLGDRHLSNILVNLTTGEVVHIDYNVCFEKGKTFAVPEKVPFRMTPNIETALGVTGIEGTFRLACEHVLKSLKKGRETLLTLLEAFVYDPLVDWAVGEDGLVVTAYAGVEAICIGELRQAKKQLEREVNRDTLAVRYTEIKPDWIQNRDDLHQQLLQMQNHLQKLEAQRTAIQLSENHRNILSKQLILIQQAEALGSAIRSHPLNTLSQRYQTYRLAKNEYELMKKMLEDKAIEAQKFTDDFLVCMRDINNDKLIEYIGDLQDDDNHLTKNETILSEYELVKEFLENSAQHQTYRLGDETRRELHNSASQQVLVIQNAFELLIQYGGIACHFTQEYQITGHRLSQYHNFFLHMIEVKSGKGSREVVAQFADGRQLQVQSIDQFVLFARHLKKTLEQLNHKLQDNCEKLKMELEHPQQQQPKSPILMYESAKSTIQAFSAHEDDAQAILEVVSLSFFTELNQKYFDLEKSVMQADAEDLSQLTLNGKWFVDELHLQTTSLTELLDVLLKDNGIANAFFIKGLHTLSATREVYGSLSEISRTLQYTVLPNVLKGIVCDDRSVLDMISAVSNLQQNLLPLDELLAILNANLEATSQNLPSPHSNALAVMMELKAKLAELTHDMQHEQHANTLGQQIFMQFHQMFEQFENVQSQLIAAIDENNKTMTKSKWKRIDQIKEARMLSTIITHPAKRAQYIDIFLVRRLEAMIEFFTMCLQLACAFKGTANLMTDNHFERISESFKKHLADYVGKMLLGIGPQYFAATICGILENVVVQQNQVDSIMKEIGGDNKASTAISLFELCHQVYEGAVKRNDLSVHGITQSTYHCGSLKEAWWRKENVIYWENTIKMETIEIQRIHHLLSAYYWINEDLILQNQQQMMNLCPIPREHILMQLRNAIQSLTGWKATIQKIRDELQVVSVAVIQRLKWAAGANPALLDLQQAFEKHTQMKRERIDKECLLAAVALKYCTSVLNFELLRIKSADSAKLDADFINLAARWNKACHMFASCAKIINPVEEALVELLDPEGAIDVAWIKNVSDLLDDMTDHAQQEISRFEKDISVSQDHLQMSAHKLRDMITKHHRLATDVKTLLKSTQKIEETMCESVRVYLSKYKEFMDTITELNGNVLSQDFTESVVKQTLEQLTMVLANVNKLFDDLFVFEKNLKERPETLEQSHKKGVMEAVQPATNCNEKEIEERPADQPLSPHKRKAQTQKEQKLNAYAVSVGRRIRMKLEGRDLDPNKRCTVQEQIDWIIREAMDLDNLAVLYEGWTPWV